MPGRPAEVRRELGRFELVLGEALGDIGGDIGVRSVGGRGERGTFHRLASSGRSSSRSSYSASISLIDLRLGCHEPLLMGRFLVSGQGARLGLFGDDRLGIRLLKDGEMRFGEGERDRFRLLIAVMANDGVDGLRRPLLIGDSLPLGKLSDCTVCWPLAGACNRAMKGLLLALVSSRLLIIVNGVLEKLSVVAGRGRGCNGFSIPFAI